MVPLLYIYALKSLLSIKRAFTEKFSLIDAVKVFSVLCVSFKEMFFGQYSKCILPTYPE